MRDTLKSLWKRYPWAVLFAVFIVAVSCLDMAYPQRKFSEIENRWLSLRPRITWDMLKNGELDDKYDKYINDQFVGRDGWISMKSAVESLLLKTENNNIVYGKDDYMFVKYDALTQDGKERARMNYGFIQEFFKMYPELPVTFTIIPNAYQILGDKLPNGLKLMDQQEVSAAFYATISERAEIFDLTETLAAHRDEYIYYRTDHHWTTYGAYLAAQAYAQSKGKSLPALDTLTAHDVPGFLGTNYSKAKKLDARPDILTYYDIPFEEFTVAGESKSSLYDAAKLDTRDKYAAFLWGNNNWTTIRTKNRVDRADGKTTRVLLIKDSYGNSFAPFLTYLYDEVDVVDLRYVNSMKPYLSDPQYYDDILLMYNFESLLSEPKLAALRY